MTTFKCDECDGQGCDDCGMVGLDLDLLFDDQETRVLDYVWHRLNDPDVRDDVIRSLGLGRMQAAANSALDYDRKTLEDLDRLRESNRKFRRSLRTIADLEVGKATLPEKTLSPLNRNGKAVIVFEVAIDSLETAKELATRALAEQEEAGA